MEFAREPAELSACQDDLRDEDDLSALQNAYLGRLRWLLRLRTDHHEDLNEQGLWLLDRSIFTTYRDCVELGVVSQGKTIGEAKANLKEAVELYLESFGAYTF
jgi:hypothetical protein